MSVEKQIEEMARDICRVKQSCNDVCHPINSCRALKYAERFYNAGYRKQSENIVTFPCKVGQTIYVVDVCAKKIIDRKVTEVAINEFGTIYIRSFGFGYPESSIGNTVFLTREEAEAKMNGEENEQREAD